MAAEKQLGKYQIVQELGRGGFGVVYLARDTSLEREVALKVLHPQLTVDAGFLEKFRNEAKTVAALDSPNIVTVYDLGEADGRIFIAMKYMTGGSLKDRIEKEGALPFGKVQTILQQVCSGLSEAHEKGLVHRDIKPANILFDGQGNAVISDFGLAKAVEMSTISVTSGAGGVGTPAYRAPELWEGKPPASAATDIYSLGCVLYEMLSGRMLFDGETTGEIITQHLVTGPQLPAEFGAGVSDHIGEILTQMLSRDPRKRYTRTQDILLAIKGGEKAAEPRQQPARPVDQTHTIKTEPGYEKDRISQEPAPARTQPGRAASPGEQPAAGKAPANRRWIFGLAGVAAVMLLVWGISMAKPASGTTPAPTKTVAVDRTSTPAQEPTSVVSPTPVLGIGSSMQSDRDGMTMLYVPAGEFEMGVENPPHIVYLDAFWIDQTEVSNEQYKLCVAAGKCNKPSHVDYYNSSAYANHPVVHVDWQSAFDYCRWAGRELPSEAQWEKAARGTDGRTYPWGNVFDSSLANVDDETTIDAYAVACGENGCDGYDRTAPVGSFPVGASPYGTLDMAGNVWEWVADWYAEDYYQNAPKENPPGPDSGGSRVKRGGSWFNDEGYILTTYRSNLTYSFSRQISRNVNPDYGTGFHDGALNDDTGFRCAMDAD